LQQADRAILTTVVSLSNPAQAAPPATLRIRTRIQESEQDAYVLRAVGEYLGPLMNADFAAVCTNPNAPWGARKRALAPVTSSRWAGAITRTAHTMYKQARAVQRTALRRTTAAIRVIRHRLALPLASDGVPIPRSRNALRGYASQHDRTMKQRRLQRLKARAARLRTDLAAGRVHVCRGGKALARHRHYLREAGLTVGEWRERWTAKRWFIHANGEKGKRYGNDTIRVFPRVDGMLVIEINLPPALRHLANAARGRYGLTARPFGRRADEWQKHVEARRACAYDIMYDPEKRRWYLGANFSPMPTTTVPTWSPATSGKVLGVDLNADHVAVTVLDSAGNPCGAPVSIPLEVHDLPASTRDGHLREAISVLIRHAQTAGCCAIACENLDFEPLRGTIREEAVHSKPVRARTLGMPTR